MLTAQFRVCQGKIINASWNLLLQHQCGLGVAQRDVLFGEADEDAAAQLAEDAVALVGADAHEHGVECLGAGDAVYAGDGGLGEEEILEGGIVADLVGELGECGDDLVGIGGGVHADVEDRHGVVAGEVLDGGDLAVGDDVHGAVGVAQGSAAQGHLLDGAGEAGDLDEVADGVLVLDEDVDAVEDVLEDGLRAEADAEADDADRGEQGLEVDVEDGQDLKQDEEGDEDVAGGAQDGGHGAHLRGVAGVGYVAGGDSMHAAHKKADEQQQ